VLAVIGFRRALAAAAALLIVGFALVAGAGALACHHIRSLDRHAGAGSGLGLGGDVIIP